MRVLVCGGRNFNDYGLLTAKLDDVCYPRDADEERTSNSVVTLFITGHCKGADMMAEEYAKDEGIKNDIYPAEWDRYGKSAGYKRNTQMLVEGKPDLVVAFKGGVGTAMMVKIAMDAGVNVLDCREL